MAVRNNGQRNENVDLIYGSEAPMEVRRNPYLMAFENQQSRKTQGQNRQSQGQSGQSCGSQERRRQNGQGGIGQDGRRQGGQSYGSQDSRRQSEQGGISQDRRRQSGQGKSAQSRPGRIQDQSADWQEEYRQATQARGAIDTYEADRAARQQAARRAAQARRRKRVLLQRVMVGIWIFCILVLVSTFLIRNVNVSAGDNGGENNGAAVGKQEGAPQYSGVMVQGLPAEEYAKHPAWTEDFLTPNEYSRPGDALEKVDNIFVHYTANPGTSAAQNRSYFEGLKDTHQTSASSHFIIGYEGEIIQCIPLDEIAYAVQSRNFDSISIECCYLKEDGSFTRETYDSLISLLAWLTDAYGLETEDILRHYDCGGKKCPLYYTENPDAWEELKKDVDKL